MKKTLTVGQVLAAIMIFHHEKYGRADMDINVAMWFIRNARELEDVRSVFEEKRNKAFDSLAEEQKDGTKEVSKENMPAFEHDIQNLLEEEVDVDLFMIDMETLKDFTISPADLAAIEIAISE